MPTFQVDNTVVTVKLKHPEYCFGGGGGKVDILTGAHLAQLTSFEEDERYADNGREEILEHEAEDEEVELEIEQEVVLEVEQGVEPEEDRQPIQGNYSSYCNT